MCVCVCVSASLCARGVTVCVYPLVAGRRGGRGRSVGYPMATTGHRETLGSKISLYQNSGSTYSIRDTYNYSPHFSLFLRCSAHIHTYPFFIFNLMKFCHWLALLLIKIHTYITVLVHHINFVTIYCGHLVLVLKVFSYDKTSSHVRACPSTTNLHILHQRKSATYIAS